MDRTKIDWADMSWNPVTGCRHGCSYCYARRIAERFGKGQKPENGNMAVLYEPVIINGEKQPYPYGFTPTFHKYKLDETEKKRRPRNIFVGSMADIFGNWIPAAWIAEIMDHCLKADRHNYLFLTKNPERYVQLDQIAMLPRKDNFFYGTTVTHSDRPYFFSDKHKTFLSMEPLMERMGAFREPVKGIDWVIIGAMTGPGSRRYQPQRKWVEEIVERCRESRIPVFMKNNLAEVWGENLIQEFPPELKIRKTYPGTCPKCGAQTFIEKSIMMEQGVNIGQGKCPRCRTLHHIRFNEEKQRMDLTPLDEYLKGLKV